MSNINIRKGWWVIVPSLLISVFGLSSTAQAVSFPDADFEDGTFTGWDRGAQTGTLGSTITSNGSGVTIFTGSRTFTHGSNNAVGDPSSQYYAPAVAAGSWTFSPNNGTNAVLLQPKGQQTFSQAVSALGLSAGSVTEIRNILTSQAQASGNGGGTPTDAAWITREVELTAGTTYTMAWNYVGTDYVPFNDGSITSLTPVNIPGTPAITVNNYAKPYALLGFTNPGTGDYSTNSYGATGWQTSTYEVSVSGTYELGFASFNLDDTSLSPALMVDSEVGSTQKCASGVCTAFGGVAPNNETAPTVPPTTTISSTTTTSSTTKTSSTSTTTTTVEPSTTTTASSSTTTLAQGNSTTTSITELATTTTMTTIPMTTIALEPITITTIYVAPVTIPPSQAVQEPVLIVPTATTTTTEVMRPIETSLPVPVLTSVPKTDTTLITETTLILLPVIPDETIVQSTYPNTTVNVGPIATLVTTPNKNQVVDTSLPDDLKIDNVSDIVTKDLNKEQLNTVMAEVFDEKASPLEIINAVNELLDGDLNKEELKVMFQNVFDDDLSDEGTISLVKEVLKGKLSDDEFTTVIGAIFDEVVTDKVLIETFNEVLKTELTVEKFQSVVGALESVVVSNNQVAQVVTLVIQQEGGIDESQATELATSSKVLESINEVQATAVFDAIVSSQVSADDGASIVEAVQEAPVEIKKAFEEQINIFEGVFDSYVAINSSIDTSSRRSLIAVTAAIATIAANMAIAGGTTAGGSGSPQGGPYGSGGGSDANRHYRKEEESEMSGEIAGGGEDEDSDYAKNSIFKYYIKEGLEMRKFNLIGFMKKLWDITAGLAFTIAGSVVVYYTLSGKTQMIALFSTITACLIHYAHQILKNDID